MCLVEKRKKTASKMERESFAGKALKVRCHTAPRTRAWNALPLSLSLLFSGVQTDVEEKSQRNFNFGFEFFSNLSPAEQSRAPGRGGGRSWSCCPSLSTAQEKHRSKTSKAKLDESSYQPWQDPNLNCRLTARKVQWPDLQYSSCWTAFKNEPNP